MSEEEKKALSVLCSTNPEEGQTILEPPGSGPGYWVGAASVIYDQESKNFYLYYRLRRPRGEEPDRGYACHIAQSKDGQNFSPIWQAEKRQFQSLSVERAALMKTSSGTYRLYISFVDVADGKWKIDCMEAASPDKFEPHERFAASGGQVPGRQRRPLDPDELGLAGVKDPYIWRLGDKYYFFVSYAPQPEESAPSAEADLHKSGDVFATGLTSSNTGLATSEDGINFTYEGDVLSPGDGWDAGASRLTSILQLPSAYLAFYDGAVSVEENYEEKTGVALTYDLRNFKRLSTEQPLLTSPHSSGSLRYMTALSVGEETYLYYEYARPDGSHELRMNKVII